MAVALAVVAGPMAAADPPENDVQAQITFNGRFLGLRVMKTIIDVDVRADTFETRSAFRTAGLAGFFQTSTVNSVGSGARAGASVTPGRYAHTETAGSKVRDVALDYEALPVAVTVTPPFGDLGEPPASPAQIAAALDPMAALTQIMVGGGDAPCARTIPVFDSRLRYDLEFQPMGEDTVRTRAYRGPAHRCRVYYRPVAGFDPEDLENGEVYDTPITVWLAPLSDRVHAPVKITATFRQGPLPLPVAIEAVRVSGDAPW